ncbi:CopD family protein [Bradyrhizobium sp. U87765 SZCCT0131]|uniref:CopD family protein n=1 Tax=unclassified Bradyrhizobium TaxID=2631580 RepID=UPI001BA78FE8|nr:MULTISPECIES: CopD family protein [unclassified Bradyrhizobium]MBR1218575.1 CopD family protein [Bradyrhizobium sp. U87765 SZCCT0131]MBR1265666.1 CopD family protein [Bradyrhizobium sp. U87765 SZCCT0134]MBR1304073.1 CopD family protein [Bradyrhizobium sp. U87765 SZCCT0110]MBR1319679.1 CopD family protein [Bradyrhizobium sp. U87765 SZCCT0109]MBR1348004.1 CopD family protein [Bradyrhizobium sp. U87765 SZCCT0048]
MLTSLYPWLKALHVICTFVFVAGLLALSSLLVAGRRAPEAVRQIAPLALRWDRLFTLPALLAVWALGMVLALSAGWFTSGWLQIKLAVVVALSAMHGMMSGQVRRFVTTGALARWSPWPWIFVSLAAIITLAVVKP